MEAALNCIESSHLAQLRVINHRRPDDTPVATEQHLGLGGMLVELLLEWETLEPLEWIKTLALGYHRLKFQEL